MSEEKKPAPKATVKLVAPKGNTACSVGGEEYKVAKDGTVEVPAEFVDHLAQHGYHGIPGKAE